RHRFRARIVSAPGLSCGRKRLALHLLGAPSVFDRAKGASLNAPDALDSRPTATPPLLEESNPELACDDPTHASRDESAAVERTATWGDILGRVAELDHLILDVSSLAASLAFYKSILGFADDGRDGPFTVLRVSPTCTLLLAQRATHGGQHLAFAMPRA